MGSIKPHKIRTGLPVHTVKHTRKRSDHKRGSARQRGYDRTWDTFSASHRRKYPLCGYCLNKGRTTAADLLDHIIPHKGDPELFWPEGEVDEHFMSCCHPCHNGPKARAEYEADRTGKDLRLILKRMGML